MLAYDALIGEAKLRGMPATKMRGVLREYLQILILKEIYRMDGGRSFCFTGGTYLRLVHRTKRFSEDLDFNAGELSKAGFEAIVGAVVPALKKEGILARVEYDHWQNIYAARLVFPDVEKFYDISSKHTKKEGIVIKVEVNRPRWKIRPHTLVVSGFGQMVPVVCTQIGALFADKIDALIKKNRARHLFDILFLLAGKHAIDEKVLRTVGVKDPPLEAIARRVESFSAQELKIQAESLRPFLFDEHEADLIISAKTVIRQLTDSYTSTQIFTA